jgi:hypothetical protein
MLYHATDDDNGCFTGGLRTTRAQRFRWRRDGTPAFGAPVSLDRDLDAPEGDRSLAVQAEDAVRRGAGARRVEDRRLFGYRGVRARPGRAGGALPRLRLRLPDSGRYGLRVRVLAGPGAGALTVMRRGARPVTRSARRPREGAVELSFGAIRLPAGRTALRMRSTRAVTLDQVRLVPARPVR